MQCSLQHAHTLSEQHVKWELIVTAYNSTLCITASGNILASGSISVKLFMAPLETIRTINLLIRRG